MSKKFALLAACAGLLLLAAPATAIEVLAGAASAATAAPNELAALPLQALLPVASLSDLPEPEVFAMMLIGCRASRDSNKTFKINRPATWPSKKQCARRRIVEFCQAVLRLAFARST